MRSRAALLTRLLRALARALDCLPPPSPQADSDDASLAEILYFLDALTPTDGGDGAELGVPGSAGVERAGRLVLVRPQPFHGIGGGAAAWEAILRRCRASPTAGGEISLGELLDGCMRFDEGTRLTAPQVLELPLFAESGGSAAPAAPPQHQP